jgi:biopolymer transport protein TolR
VSFGKIEKPRSAAPMSEINMTPLIDVMLVLLVIFMLTAPLMTSSLKLNLPKTDGAQPQVPDPQAIRLSLQADGQLRWDDDAIDMAAFSERLKPLQGSDSPVYLRADQNVSYGKVAELIGLLQQAELRKIAFVAEPKAQGASQPRAVSAAALPP